MALPVCPVCHKRAHVAGQQLYCTNCGWNRDAGISALNHNLRMTPVGIALFAGFGALSFKFMGVRNPQQFAIVVVPIAFALAFNYVYTKGRLAKLRGLPANASGGSLPAPGWQVSVVRTSQTMPASVSAPVTASAANPEYEALLSIPRPRQVRMSGQGRFIIAVICLVVLGFGAVFAARLFSSLTRMASFSGFHSGGWVVVALAAAIFLFPYGLWYMQRRECDLLENGEVAMGHITGQWRNRNGCSVRYEFTDFLGQSHSGMGSDFTRKLQQGMSVPVFYDRDKPNRQIAYCSTLHKIVV